jgi:predicted transcriptional regulator
VSELSWSCLSNHARVLVALGRDPYARIRDLAQTVELTERAVQRIVGELVSSGMVERRREGRRNFYTMRRDQPLRHRMESHRTVGDLIDLFSDQVGEPGPQNGDPEKDEDRRVVA